MKPLLLVGRENLNQGVIQELDRLLEAHEIVKVRFLRNSDRSKKGQMISQLAKETLSELVMERGNTASLFRPHPSATGKIYKDKSARRPKGP